ncbi:hypothetical protein MINTMi27_15730 [Mycobacterium intracellulare]|uniref:hypothetical protein n=1 Tax=Mycobacterium intracellulare TaxID=1767 RepID=UPI001928A063|nr:hypothetical protein [Mycobacterium intracellulare]BCP41480.1 hypothetical protein MINTMi27_15730 [Mycobacterium intracellulare]
MPKEIIQFAQTELPSGQRVADATSLELRWSKPEAGGNLQLRFQRHVWDKSFRDSGIQEVDQYTDQLSRDDCNRMIRALRRARDQVYGADA